MDVEIQSTGQITRNCHRSIDSDVVQEDGEDKNIVQLQRSLSVFDGIMINVGIMIGTGIFISPKGVAAGVESVGATLCVWVAAGVIALLGALCYAELGTTIPASGGTYTYIQVCFGDFAGFINFWANTVIVSPSSNAVVALMFSIYCLEPFYPDPDCPPPKMAIKLFAILSISFTMFLNCWSVKLTTVLQNTLSICKLIPLCILLISGIVKIGMGSTENFKEPFASTDVSGIGTALYSSLFGYDGWQSINVVTEELKNPSRNLPLSLIISISITSFVYTLTNVAYFTALSPSGLVASDAVAFSYAQLVLGKFAVIIPITVVLSTLGCLNGSILSSSREFFVGARRGHLPSFLSTIGIHHKTPIPSVILNSMITITWCFVDSVFTIINFFSFVQWFFFGSAVTGLIYLRIKEPNRPRPFKVNIFFPVTFVVVCICLTILGFIGAPMDSLIATAIIISGIPIYFVLVHQPSPRGKWAKGVKRSILVFLQKLLFVSPEECKET
ncbi:Y+L amino acid transporter 2-like [Lytechinus variegatus]|uniref:Y+L amino acid transporter 2-like n=1 Tax=Lytechinus variegatus TaxID=7654 RepID=UPI001BB1D28D|nr:Y+L amino acid transporter 2-like [Lytechinus variegatus]